MSTPAGYSPEYLAAIERAKVRFRELWTEADRPVHFEERLRPSGIDGMPQAVRDWADTIFEEELAAGYEMSSNQLSIAWFSVWDQWNAAPGRGASA